METIEAIILAKGAPNRTSDGRTVMCSIAISETHGLVRFYPLSITGHSDVSIWSKGVFACSKGAKDSRQESWRVASYEVTGKITDRGEKSAILDACVLQSGTEEPIQYQNEQRASIAIVKPFGCIGAELQPRVNAKSYCTGEGEDGFAMVQANYPFKPYITWYPIQRDCESKDPLRTHLVGQEVYEGMRHNIATPFRIFENMRIGDPDYQHWLVLGNMNNRRTTWVIAHLHRQKKVIQQDMLASLWIGDGRPKGWPYLKQEAGNAKDAGPQMQFNFTTDGTE